MNWQELLYIDLYHGYIPQILIGELIFFLHTERKEHFVHRVCIGLPCFLLLAVLLPNLIAHYVSGFFSLTIFLLSMGFWAYCMDADFSQILFCCVAAQLVQNLSYQIENLVYLPFAAHFSEIGRFCWSLVCMAGVYTAAALLLGRRLISGNLKRPNQRFIFGFSIVTTLFVYLMQYLYLGRKCLCR